VYGHAGDDRLIDNGSGSAHLLGGEGNDTLVSIGGGADTLAGGAGLDSFWADTNDTISDASATETAVNAIHRVGAFYQPYSSNPSHASYVSLECTGQDLTDPVADGYASGWANFSQYELFTDGPQLNDIRQGSVGDCYFLSVLSSYADQDPEVIRQMIVDLGDGTYALRGYHNGNEIYVRLDADLPTYSSGTPAYAKLTPDNELWVALAEKAYAYIRTGENSYASISGGWMSDVVTQIANVSTSLRWTSTGSSTDLWNHLAQELAAGHSVTIGSSHSASSPVVGGHAYVVESVRQTSGGDLMVTVYNPWGIDGRTWDDNSSDGLLELDIDTLVDNYTAVVTSIA
jgi:hypothetical protein